jgi:hypothetical protein
MGMVGIENWRAAAAEWRAPASDWRSIAAEWRPPASDWRPLAAAAVETYEAGIRAATDLQRRAAQAIPAEPLHTIATASADLTRDVGAVVASRARWLLDV